MYSREPSTLRESVLSGTKGIVGFSSHLRYVERVAKMAFPRSTKALLLLIAAVGIWTDIHFLARGATGTGNFLLVISCILLIVGFLAIFTERKRLTRWAMIGGTALLMLGTIAG